MQPDPSAREPHGSSWHRLRRRSVLRVLGLAATGGLTAALTASGVAPAAGAPVPRALPVNTDLLGATGALPAAAAPADATALVPTGAGSTGRRTAPPGSAPTGTAARSAAARPQDGTTVPVLGPDHLGIPARVLAAYQRAEATTTHDDAGCHLRWWVLAGIGRIEASHAEGGRLDVHGSAVPPIFGPVLNGQPGMAAVADTDGGRLDADPVWDRAVGPMQFLPGSWQVYGAGGDPQNVDDAALAAARYLCAGGADLAVAPQLERAVFNYNHSDVYVADVLGWAHGYERGVTATPAPPLLAQQVRTDQSAGPTRVAAALQARSAPARVAPRPATPSRVLPVGTRPPTTSALPGAPTPVAPPAGAATPVVTTAAPATGASPAPTAPVPATKPTTAGPPVGAPAAGTTAPAVAPPVVAGPAPTDPIVAPAIGALPAVAAAGTPACQPSSPSPVPPPSAVPATPPAPVVPVAPVVAPPAVGAPPTPVGQPGPITEVGTVSAISCLLATLTRLDGTVLTVDLALLRVVPVVGDRVLVTGSLSPDGKVLVATTSTRAP